MIGIAIALLILVYGSYKGLSTLWVAPICAIIVAIGSGQDGFGAYTQSFMEGFASFTQGYLPIFLLGAIFGKMMERTGAAHAVGNAIIKVVGKKRAILAVVLACAIMTYGGISLFVVMFVIYPIAAALFRDANVARQLFPGAFALGSYTFTMTGLPGSPQIQNLIPIKYFGTTPMAAPVLGCIASAILLALGMIWMTYRQRSFEKQGIGWTENPNSDATDSGEAAFPKMNTILAFLPLITVVIVLNVIGMDVIYALVAGILVNMICTIKAVKIKDMLSTLSDGAISSLEPTLLTASVVGFGTVVKLSPSFNVMADTILGIDTNPLIILVIAVNLLAGVCGSASGGMSIALTALGDKFIALSQSSGIPLSVFHRLTSLSSGGLDTLPFEGGVCTILKLSGCTHKESYIDVCMTSLVFPIVTAFISVALASIGLGLILK
jgi:H+/gluconate symporter-like permease